MGLEHPFMIETTRTAPKSLSNLIFARYIEIKVNNLKVYTLQNFTFIHRQKGFNAILQGWATVYWCYSLYKKKIKQTYLQRHLTALQKDTFYVKRKKSNLLFTDLMDRVYIWGC